MTKASRDRRGQNRKDSAKFKKQQVDRYIQFAREQYKKAADSKQRREDFIKRRIQHPLTLEEIKKYAVSVMTEHPDKYPTIWL